MRDYTDIVVLLDRSGSMQSVKEAMEGAFVTFLKEHAKIPSTRFTLIQFDDINDSQVVVQGVPVGSVKKVVIKPRGNTPLIDAFVKAIDATGVRLADLDEADRPSKVIFTVITDGEENASKQYRRNDVASRVRRQTNDYNWQFIYLGANQDTFKESQSYGISWGNTIKWSPTEQNIGGLASSWTTNTAKFASGGLASAGGYSNIQRVKSATLTDLAVDSNPDKDDLLIKVEP